MTETTGKSAAAALAKELLRERIALVNDLGALSVSTSLGPTVAVRCGPTRGHGDSQSREPRSDPWVG
jgi:hypothetical protein